MTYRYKLTIEYHGSFFSGWQRQKSTSRTVQQTIEEALLPLQKTENNIPRLFCAGRTDTGVHALGQVAHVDIERDLPAFKLLQATNHYLSKAPVRIVDCCALGRAENSSFHARFSCIERSYQYLIANRRPSLAIGRGLFWHIPEPLDTPKMQEACRYLIGKQDLSSFRAAGCQANSPIRSIYEAHITKEKDEIRFFIRAPSFLYHQVRNIIGSLIMVGKGKWDVDHFRDVIAFADRTKAGPTAPSDGLYFLAAHYEEETHCPLNP